MACAVSVALAAAAGRPSALDPIAAVVMEVTPVDAANALLLGLGDAAKPLALVGAAAVVMGCVAVIWRIARNGRRGLAVAGVLGTAGAAWLGARSETLSFATFLAMLSLLLGVRYPSTKPARSARRRSVLRVGANVAALALIGGAPPLASLARAWLLAERAGRALFAFKPPLPRGPGFDVAGLTDEITPTGAFYRMSKNVADPAISWAGWRLRVVSDARAREWSLDEILSLPATHRYVTMQCVSNPVGGPLWSAALFTGCTLADLLQEVPLNDGAMALFRGVDGHVERVPLAWAQGDSCILAFGMNGAMLDTSHGFPLRLVAGGAYGFRSVKWLSEIEVSANVSPGHWESRGWTAFEVNTTTRVDVARSDGLCAGVAFAGRRGVQSVSARVAGGPWIPAELHLPPLAQSMWVQWRAALGPLEPGSVIEAYAVDGAGQAQIEVGRPQFPGGATGLHRRLVSA
ncbi:MAG: molybdopterin-dependent oxidoreductase [Chloroflexota bacterium]